jgi:adenylate kinase
MNIVLLGPPGSGKGTQAKRMAEVLKTPHLSTGDVFRDAIKGQTKLGIEIKSFVDGGKLVPDELVSAVVFEKLGQMKNGYLLDGYPRTVGQAQAFDGYLAKNKSGLDAILFFNVEFKELVRRLSSRRQCGNCKEVYNLALNPPKKEGKCDKCQGALVHRPDDQPDIVQKRLDIYTKETAPILDYYKKHEGFFEINAANEIDKVFKDVMAALSKQKVK